jgi:hypothetical protein
LSPEKGYRQNVIRAVRIVAIFLAVLLPGACSDVPQEAVTLSVTVGRDLAEAHRAHRALAERYFGTLRANVAAFIQDTYRPFMVRDVLSRKAPGQSLTMWERIVAQAEAAKKGEPGADPLGFMSVTVSLITKQVETARAELMKPVADQEAEVLRAIDDTYNRLQQAQAVVTAHLSSVRRVHEAQDEILTRAGLDDLRRKVIDKTADASDRIADIVEKARRGEADADEALEKIKGVLSTIRN